MLEEPKLTLRILKHLGSNEVGFPAEENLGTLHSKMSDVALEHLTYHVVIAKEDGLILASIDKNYNFGRKSGPAYTYVVSIDGLTAAGGRYVQMAEKGNWDKAVEALQEQAFPITTTAIIDVLTSWFTFKAPKLTPN